MFLVLLKLCFLNECFMQTVANLDVKPFTKTKIHARRLQPNTHTYLYLNYKDTYGLRFNPKNIHKKRQTNTPHDVQSEMPILPASSTLPASEVIISTTIESDGIKTVSISTENNSIVTKTIASPSSSDISITTQSTSSTSMIENKVLTTEVIRPNKQQGLPFSSLLNHSNASQRPNETLTEQTKPQSPLKQTLQWIQKRIKQWLSYGTDPKASLVNGQRFLNIFNVIRFDNSPCTSTQDGFIEMSGICYQDFQCAEMGGSVIDECADGLGVCCVCMKRTVFSIFS